MNTRLFIDLHKILAAWSDVVIAISDSMKTQLLERKFAAPAKI